MSSTPVNVGNNFFLGVQAQPVSCGDEGMNVDEHSNFIQVKIMYGLGPAIIDAVQWAVWHTRRMMKFAQKLLGEAKKIMH